MKKTIAILSALLIAAVIVAGVFISQKNAVSSEKDELSTKVETLSAQVEDLKEKEKANMEEAANTQSALDEANKELEQLKKTAEENAAAIDKANEENAKLEEDIKKLKADAQELESSKKTADENLKTAQDELKALQEEKAALEEKINAFDSNTKELEDKLGELEETKKAAEAKLNAAETDKKAAEENLKTAQDELKALQEEKTSLEEKVNAFDSNTKELEEAKKAAEEKLNAAEDAKKTAEENLKSAQDELKALQGEKDQLNEQLAAIAAKTEAKEQEEKAEAEKASETSSVIILSTNDVHARVEGNDKNQIGYPRLIAIAKELRKDNEVILLDAGDVLHGTAFANLTQGESIVNLMNLAGYSASAPGNHDFNYGYDRLMELEKKMDFPLVNANIYKDGEHAFAPYTIIQAGSRNIAVIGAANPQMESAIHPDRIKGLEFKDYTALNDIVEEVRPHVDAVIILAHWGASDAYEPNSSVLAKIPGVDLVVDGHSHTPFEEIKQNDGAALIVSAGEYMGEIGCVKMNFTENGVECSGDSISFEEANSYAPDEEASKLINDLKDEQQELMSVVIGKTDVPLDGERETNRTRETNLGNLAADAIIWYTDADFAFTNGGGIRTSIPAGNITQGNIIEVFPFGNSVVIIEATGEQILSAMELGLSKYPETSGGFPQISGAKIVYNPEKPEGERIVEMSIQGKPVEKDKKYTVATNDFTAAGGDGYVMLKDCPVIMYQGTLDEAFIGYVKEIGTVNIDIEGRIVQQTKVGMDENYEVPETVPAP